MEEPIAAKSTPFKAAQAATVFNVVDGDTIDVLIDGRAYRVR